MAKAQRNTRKIRRISYESFRNAVDANACCAGDGTDTTIADAISNASAGDTIFDTTDANGHAYPIVNYLYQCNNAYDGVGGVDDTTNYNPFDLGMTIDGTAMRFTQDFTVTWEDYTDTLVYGEAEEPEPEPDTGAGFLRGVNVNGVQIGVIDETEIEADAAQAARTRITDYCPYRCVGAARCTEDYGAWLSVPTRPVFRDERGLGNR